MLAGALEMATKEKKERNCWCRLKKSPQCRGAGKISGRGRRGETDRQQDRRLMRHQLNKNVALIAEKQKNNISKTTEQQQKAARTIKIIKSSS